MSPLEFSYPTIEAPEYFNIAEKMTSKQPYEDDRNLKEEIIKSLKEIQKNPRSAREMNKNA